MNEIQKRALLQGIKLLNASGAQFAVIDSDGTKYGTLEIKPVIKGKTLRNRAGNAVPQGYYSQVIKPVLRELQPGTVGEIEVVPGARSTAAFRSAVTGHASALWGSGNYTTHIVRRGSKATVQVLRFA